MMDLNVTFIIITKDRPKMVRRLVDSILKANLDAFSLVLIDDSSPDNFLKTKDFLQSRSMQFLQLSTAEAGRQIEKTLEKANLTPAQKEFIKNCTGLRSPFCGYVEQFFDQDEPRGESTDVGLRFAPYSAARNLGIYCATRLFNPENIFFLDDDCLILHPEKLKSQIRSMERKVNQKQIVATAGIYKDLSTSRPQKNSDHRISAKIIRILRGMDAFLRKSLAVEKARFKIMPPHMLGGALILSKRVFCSLPFDPYVARGEDHTFAWDLKGYLARNEVAICDNQFIVGHKREEISPKQADLNVLRDIFRFVYIQTKTGRSFIPLFTVRWTLASLTQLFLNPLKYTQRKKELSALVYLAPRFAKENAHKFKQNLKAWNNFLS